MVRINLKIYGFGFTLEAARPPFLQADGEGDGEGEGEGKGMGNGRGRVST